MQITPSLCGVSHSALFVFSFSMHRLVRAALTKQSQVQPPFAEAFRDRTIQYTIVNYYACQQN